VWQPLGSGRCGLHALKHHVQGRTHLINLARPWGALLARATSGSLSSCQLHQLLLLNQLLVEALLTTWTCLLLLSGAEFSVEEMLLLLAGPVRLQKLLKVLSAAPSAPETVAE